MGFVKILPWADGDNSRRIDGFMAAVVVGTDVVKIDRFRDARHLIDIAQEPIEIEIVADAMLIALKVGHIDRIETDKRCPQADVRLG